MELSRRGSLAGKRSEFMKEIGTLVGAHTNAFKHGILSIFLGGVVGVGRSGVKPHCAHSGRGFIF
jgi:hypothetical protein